MQDELDKMTDAELSECFAVDVAGWKFYAPPSKFRWDDEHGTPRSDEPEFATSADAILPWLESNTWRGWSYKSENGSHKSAEVEIVSTVYTLIKGQSTTFARAACIALLRAKRSSAK